MDQKETHKCFSSNHVRKTDIKAPLLDLMAEQTESASGEGFRLLGGHLLRQRGALASFWLQRLCRED